MTEAPFFWNEVTESARLRGAFIPRVAGVELTHDKWEVIDALEPCHRKEVEKLGFEWASLWRAEQVHGAEVAVVPSFDHDYLSIADEERDKVIVGVDALVTNLPGVMLGIYVADCGAVYFHDRQTGAIGLAHSGKKGTEGNITKRVIEMMGQEFGTKASDVAVGLAPCIRPPYYEIDFAADIARQAAEMEVAAFEDCGVCTGAAVSDCYSYRIEEGKTGRMLALLGVKDSE